MDPDSPLVRQLREEIASGTLADPVGPDALLTLRELSRWLPSSNAADWKPSGAWVEPLVEARLTLSGAQDRFRPYSTELRPRQIAGGPSASCAFDRGLPCGAGAGGLVLLESAAGVSQWLTGDVRLALGGGNHDYSRLALDRAYVLAESDYFVGEVGRDTLTLGPEARTQLLWSANAPPVNLVRAATAGFVPFFGVNPDVFRISASLFLARLDGPQRFPGALVSGQQLAIQVLRRLELTGARLLQFGGDGAPPLTFGEVLAEHFTRKGTDEGLNYSNNRLELGASLQLPGPAWPRVYYSLVMEDTRTHVIDMLRYDTDHLVGLEWEALGSGHDGHLVVEALQTGIRSGEHGIWTTGMTTGGYSVGSPLGPDARAFVIDTEWTVGRARVGAALQVARLSSDLYSDDGENIRRTRPQTPELRYQISPRMEWMVSPHASVQVSAFVEEVRQFGFTAGADRLDFGGAASFVWRRWGGA